MNIGLDFDGVIADTTKLKQKLAKKFYKVIIPTHRFKEYMVLEDGLLTKNQYRRLMNIVCGDKKYGLDIIEVDEAIKYILDFINNEYKLKVITSREGKELDVAKMWCEQNGLDLDFISVGYNQNKVEAVKGLEVYIDDDLPKLTPLISIVPQLYLYTQEHNKNKDVPKEIKRIFSWSEFANIIKK